MINEFHYGQIWKFDHHHLHLVYHFTVTLKYKQFLAILIATIVATKHKALIISLLNWLYIYVYNNGNDIKNIYNDINDI